MKKIIIGALAITLCLTMIGCNKDKNEQTKTNSGTNGSSATNQSTNNSEEEILEIENSEEQFMPSVVEKDDSRIVIQTDTNSQVTYYHEGNEIKGMEARITYDNPKAAELAKDTLDADKEILNYDSVTVDGNSIIIKYPSEVYEGLGYDSVEESYIMSFDSEEE